MDAPALRRLIDARIADHEENARRSRHGYRKGVGSDAEFLARARCAECRAILAAMDAAEKVQPAPPEPGPG